MTGVHGVFSVQPSSPTRELSDEDETSDGVAIADIAVEAGVGHLAYSSGAAVGDEPTGMGHFDSKARIEAHNPRPAADVDNCASGDRHGHADDARVRSGRESLQLLRAAGPVDAIPCGRGHWQVRGADLRWSLPLQRADVGNCQRHCHRCRDWRGLLKGSWPTNRIFPLPGRAAGDQPLPGGAGCARRRQPARRSCRSGGAAAAKPGNPYVRIMAGRHWP